ncbi:conserved hypothetical protein [Altererythrobacter sp. B11]|uniref:DUF6894 family protein n=1 Tax=Altererythrobacter sp. B11 TaxID=2060312 RepID=UPI000DC73B47|nr:hypothetical protein [Altererythrobacter sp. B11]BBC71867.1 conserved hypothetical protein [Altererythrobacter sp. B11]
MPRFFIEVVDHAGIAEDHVGLECRDFPHARLCAIEGIRSLLADEMRQGRLDLGGRAVIMDEARRELETLPFTAAFETIRESDG